MHARERIIRERFATQTCEGCGQPYLPGSVLILARRRAAWMVLVSCARCDHRGIFVVSFHQSARSNPDRWGYSDEADPHRDDVFAEPTALPESLAVSAQTPVTTEEVARMHEFLTHFDGDFRKLFSSTPPPPSPS
jgi:hypothetical protein